MSDSELGIVSQPSFATPTIITRAGPSTRNAHTRAAYYRAIQQFLAWSERAGCQHLEDIEPITVAAYMGSTQSTRHFVAPIDRIAARIQFYLLTLMR
jgi:site-specific recombinase XerD